MSITTPLPLNITGRDAIDLYQGVGGGLRLDKFADPIEGARAGLTVAEALDVVAQDPGLVFLVAEVDWYGDDSETIAQCGLMQLLVQSPDARRGEIEVFRTDDIPGGMAPIEGAPDVDLMTSAAVRIEAYLREAQG